VPRALPLNPTDEPLSRQDDAMKKLSKRLNFRIDEETFDAFEKKVDASGLTKSEFFRDMVLTNRTQVIERKKKTDNTQRALYLINKSSNNINQLAKAANIANIKGEVSNNLYLNLLESLETHNQLLRALLDHVD
jgi:CRISPR/Cas system CSM-associated protein Csm3 (group 7 of RAMP superfamily)